MTDGPFKPTPQDVITAPTNRIADPRYDALRGIAGKPDYSGLLFELEGPNQIPPHLGAKVNRLCSITPEGLHPVNLRRDIRDIVGYLDKQLTPIPLTNPTLEHTMRVGNQVALKKEIESKGRAFVIELWPALAEQPEDAETPADIIDPSKTTRIMYYRSAYNDGVGFIGIAWAEVTPNKTKTLFDDGQIALLTTPSTFIFREPNYKRQIRLDHKKRLGHDVFDPRFQNKS